MDIQPRDTSKWHFWVSIFKSLVRGMAGYALIQAGLVMQDVSIIKTMEGNGGLWAAANILMVAGFLIIVAEVLGIIEELK